MPQTPSGNGPALGLPHTPQINSLITKARAANSEKGAEAYSADLAGFLVDVRAGKGYVRKFSKRLATADLMARRGKQGWVSEAAVVRAFNELMEQVAGSPSEQIKTDISVVHQLRFSLYNTSPDLSSVTSHHEECLPSEAVFLVWLLLLNNGTAGMPLPRNLQVPRSSGKGYVMAIFPSSPDASLLLGQYLRVHSRSQLVSLYESVAEAIGL